MNQNALHRNQISDAHSVELPIPSQDNGTWGSDVAAEMLRALDIPYVALS
jgi:hypothetical protein